MGAQPLCQEMIMVRIKEMIMVRIRGRRKRSFKQHLQVQGAKKARGH
jgi:hypothetical protein